MSRLIQVGSVAFDQVDVFTPGPGVNRAQGLTTESFSLTAFANNQILQWPLVEGGGISDSAVTSGSVYLNEIPGAPGFYSVRFLPNRLGFWRLTFKVSSFETEIVREFEVAPATLFQPKPDGGLSTSFT